jgi:hypothetical protein
MDWLRSEDLKEEKVVTAPAATITRRTYFGCLDPNCPVVRSSHCGGKDKQRNFRLRTLLVVENDVEK